MGFDYRRCLFSLVMLGLMVGVLLAESFTKGVQQQPFTQLKPGDYVWRPEVSPNGPVVIIVSIPAQTLYVYRNGVRIGRSTISSGKEGHDTPTGVFTILQKNVKHTSSIYKGASMPYMQRLTWTGIAMHAGKLPGYPASHGCVRLPLDFAEKLYTVTNKGSTVIVTNGKAASDLTAQPGLLLAHSSNVSQRPLDARGFVWEPEKAPDGPVSILFSSADREAYVYRNGVEIGRCVIGERDGENEFGNHAYTALDEMDPDGSHEWEAIDNVDGTSAPDLKRLIKELAIPPVFLAQARSVVTPGTTLIITDQPVNRTTHSGTDFSILTASK